MIQFDGAFYGPYRSQARAINHAIDTAQLAQGKSQVLVADDNTGETFALHWTFGVDAYPPPKPVRKPKGPPPAKT